jgi:hypothetical protein
LRPIAAACSGVFTPKPTATGRSVCFLIRSMAEATRSESGAAVPVMPVMET